MLAESVIENNIWRNRSVSRMDTGASRNDSHIHLILLIEFFTVSCFVFIALAGVIT